MYIKDIKNRDHAEINRKQMITRKFNIKMSHEISFLQRQSHNKIAFTGVSANNLIL
jgi:hypothetical protein